jgi:hypothetical protein
MTVPSARPHAPLPRISIFTLRVAAPCRPILPTWAPTQLSAPPHERVFPHAPPSPVLAMCTLPPPISPGLKIGTVESSPSSPNPTTKQPSTTAASQRPPPLLIADLAGAWYQVCCVVAVWLHHPSHRVSCRHIVVVLLQIQTLQPNNHQPQPPSPSPPPPIADLIRARDWDRRIVTVSVGLQRHAVVLDTSLSHHCRWIHTGPGPSRRHRRFIDIGLRCRADILDPSVVTS